MSRMRNLYILCGGRSRRMGQDKALMKVGGESLLNKQISNSSSYFKEIVLLSGENVYPVEFRQLNDEITDAGPLSGLLTALKDGKNRSEKLITIFPVDLPYLSETTIQKLSSIKPKETDEAVFLKSNFDIQPLAGVYRTRLIDKLEEYLKTGNRMVFGFANSLNYSIIHVKEDELRNINTKDDIEGLPD